MSQSSSASTVSITPQGSYRPEGQSGLTAYTFSLTRSGDTSQAQTVGYAVTGYAPPNPGLPIQAQTADGADFVGGTLPSGTVSFGVGETSKTISVNVSGDTVVEGNEGFAVTLSNPSASLAINSGAGMATGAILNDDPGVVRYSFDNITLKDQITNEAFGVLNGTFQIDFTGIMPTASGTLTFDPVGAGLPTLNGTPLVSAGPGAYSLQLGKALALDIQNTTKFGADATGDGLLLLGWPDTTPTPTTIQGVSYFAPGATIDFSSVTPVYSGVWHNTQETPVSAQALSQTPSSTLSIVATSADKAEGRSGATGYTFTVTRSGDTSVAHTVNWAVSGPVVNAEDFVGGVMPGGLVSFAVGETSKLITVNVTGDTMIESDEAFTVTLSDPSAGAILGNATAIGTIRNDDSTASSTVSITPQGSNRPEGQSGLTAYTFSLNRSGDTSQAQTVGYAVTGYAPPNPGLPIQAQTADVADFVGGTLPVGTVSFDVGEISKTITINVSGDTAVEGNEGFAVTLSNPSAGLTINSGAEMATGTILNDDPGAVRYSFDNITLKDQITNEVFGVLNGTFQVVFTGIMPTVSGSLTFDPAGAGLATLTGTPSAFAGPGVYALQLGKALAAQNMTLIGADATGDGVLFLSWPDTTPTPSTIQGVSYFAPGATLDISSGTPVYSGVVHFNQSAPVSAQALTQRLLSFPAHDLNGDGTADLLWKNGVDYAALVTSSLGANSGVSNLTQPTAAYEYVGSAQINGTGGYEPIWSKDGTGVSIGAGSGNPLTFVQKTVAQPSSGWTYWNAADMTGDGRSELLWKYGEIIGVTILDANQNKISDNWYSSPGADWKAVAAVKLNGDANTDILWKNDALGGALASTLTNSDGTGFSSAAWLSKPGAGWEYFGTGDFNADGRSDTVWTTQEDYMAVMLTGADGASTNGSYWFSKPGAGWELQAVGDFNADGRADTLWWNEALQGTASYLTEAVFNTSGAPNAYGYWLGSPGVGWSYAGIGDFNGNGRMDVLFQNADGAGAALITNATGTEASAQWIGSPGTSWGLVG